MTKVEGLTKRYARTVAVDDISFEVAKGRIIGFLGPLILILVGLALVQKYVLKGV